MGAVAVIYNLIDCLVNVSPNNRAVGGIPGIAPAVRLIRGVAIYGKTFAVIERVPAYDGNALGDNYACKCGATGKCAFAY